MSSWIVVVYSWVWLKPQMYPVNLVIEKPEGSSQFSHVTTREERGKLHLFPGWFQEVTDSRDRGSCTWVGLSFGDDHFVSYFRSSTASGVDLDISFVPVVASTSGHLHCELVRILFWQTPRGTVFFMLQEFKQSLLAV